MNDFIFNVLPAQGPMIGGFTISPQIVGSFLAIVVSVVIAMITIKRNGDSNRRYIDAVEKSSRKHIEAVEKTSEDQIIEGRYWRDLKRKQQLKSLVQEFNTNKILFNRIAKMDENRGYVSSYLNFNLSVIEKCLTDTPIDDNAINRSLSAMYLIIKSHDNKIIASRSPSLDDETRELLIQHIATDYKKHLDTLDELVKRINVYEQSIELHPLPDRTETVITIN
jgi:hypothetical protein